MYYGGIGQSGGTGIRSTGRSSTDCPDEFRRNVDDCKWFERYLETRQLFFDWGFSPPMTVGSENRRAMMVYPDCVPRGRHARAVRRSRKDPEAWGSDFYGDHLPEIAIREMPVCPEGVPPRYVQQGADDYTDRATYRGIPWMLIGGAAVVGVGALIWFGGKS